MGKTLVRLTKLAITAAPIVIGLAQGVKKILDENKKQQDGSQDKSNAKEIANAEIRLSIPTPILDSLNQVTETTGKPLATILEEASERYVRQLAKQKAGYILWWHKEGDTKMESEPPIVTVHPSQIPTSGDPPMNAS